MKATKENFDVKYGLKTRVWGMTEWLPFYIGHKTAHSDHALQMIGVHGQKNLLPVQSSAKSCT